MKMCINKSGCSMICKTMLYLFMVLILLGCDQQDRSKNIAQKSSQTPQSARVYDGTIIVLGDSLTAGLGVAEKEAFPAILEEKLQQSGFEWQVLNGGISGETSSGALSRTNWIIAQQPDIVILETGANDGLRGIPAEFIEKNINQTVQLLQHAGVEVVLAGMQMLQNLGPSYTKAFKAIYPAVAQEQHVILIPFLLEQVAGDPDLNLPDGIHPTPAGHRIVAQTVYPFVVEAIKKRQR